MCTEIKKVQAAVKVRVATYNYRLAKTKILSYCSRKSCSSSGPGKSGCPCPRDSTPKYSGDCSTAWKGSYHHVLLQLFPKKYTPVGIFKKCEHVRAYLLWSKTSSHSGSPGYGIRQAQLVSGSWLGVHCLCWEEAVDTCTRQSVLGLHGGFPHIKWKAVAFWHPGQYPVWHVAAELLPSTGVLKYSQSVVGWPLFLVLNNRRQNLDSGPDNWKRTSYLHKTDEE